MRVDGRTLGGRACFDADIAVVGSGPAGASVARVAARAGARVVVLEAGPWIEPEAFPESAFAAMSQSYRGMGAQVLVGPAPIPYLQGRMVGGSSPINGAICWRTPRDVHREWLDADPALEETLSWGALEAATDEVEARLGVAPTDPRVAGPKNLLMARGAEALGLSHRPIRRNVRGCEGLGRCMQGCPKGRKLSVDRTLLEDAMAAGAHVLSSVEVRGLSRRRGRMTGVTGRAAGGGAVVVRAERVVLAASAVQTPGLLLRNGIRHGPVGRHFTCHPGVSMAGRFAEPVRMWEGATQGHEVTGLRAEGLKFEALGFGLGILAGRLDGFGRDLARQVDDIAHWLDWGAAVRARAEGRVRLVLGRPVVSFRPAPDDVRSFRRALRVLGEMMFAAGAQRVSPGVRGFDASVTHPRALQRLERDGPTHAGAFMSAVTHMFGTCRMGSDPRASVVRPDFRHHVVDGLYVADSSVFPRSLGVNPQIPIMAVAALCGRRVLESLS